MNFMKGLCMCFFVMQLLFLILNMASTKNFGSSQSVSAFVLGLQVKLLQMWLLRITCLLPTLETLQQITVFNLIVLVSF